MYSRNIRMIKVLFSIISLSISIFATFTIDSISENSSSILATFFSFGAGIIIASIVMFSNLELLKDKSWRYIHFYSKFLKSKTYPVIIILYLYIITTMLLAINGFEISADNFSLFKIITQKLSIFLSIFSFFYTLQLPILILSHIHTAIEELKSDTSNKLSS